MPETENATTAEILARALAGLGVRHAFGLIGSTVAPLAEALARQPGVRVVPTRHEQIAAHMADATARLTRRPTVCYAHGAPGGLNLVMGAATAYRDSSPVIFVTGDVERDQHGHEAWQSLDGLAEVFAPITKASWRIEHPEAALEWLERAVRLAVAGRPGPVHLQVPRDVLHTPHAGAAPAAGECQVPPVRPAPDPEVLAAMAAELQRAERPVILAGGGIMWSGAEAALEALAQRLGCPVITSQTCRGAVDEAGPWCVGASGHLGNPVAGHALRDADVVLAVGNRLSDLQTDYGKLLHGQVLLHADVDPAQLGRFHPARCAACADARLFLTQLAAQLPARPRSAWLESLIAERDAWQAEQFAEGDGTFGPRAVARAVGAVLPDDALISIGAGRHAQHSTLLARRRPSTHLKAIGSAAMGFAFPAALAALVVDPQRPAVALVGDGDFLMGVQDLETAVREHLPAISVVFNDFRLASQAGRGYSIGIHHGNPDFVALAEAFGCLGLRAANEADCRQALETALASGRPAVVDARIQG